jgi:hypothetical protein
MIENNLGTIKRASKDRISKAVSMIWEFPWYIPTPLTIKNAKPSTMMIMSQAFQMSTA